MPSKSLEIDPAAEEEVREAYKWYRDRSQRAAEAFLTELEAAFAAIQVDPNRFGAFLHGCRRRKLKRYPYLVIYRELPNTLQVIAVAHARRRPGYWRSRAT